MDNETQTTVGEQDPHRTGLAPCPFCGSKESREIDLSYDDPWFAIQCWRNGKVGCGASVGSMLGWDHARLYWNRRVPQISQDVERLNWLENNGGWFGDENLRAKWTISIPAPDNNSHSPTTLRQAIDAARKA